ncbi:MAG: flagellar biosynthesis protein FliQ [Phycisphaerales bacterium]|nr:flagellar biosynthesis protein FliQ [Phycisphaerales bacterium]
MIDGSLLELVRHAMVMTLEIAGPVLVAGLVIGLVISIVQAVTQIQEQTLTIVPKIVAMSVMLVVLLPWIVAKIADFAVSMFRLV